MGFCKSLCYWDSLDAGFRFSWSFLSSDTSSRVTARQCKALISRPKRIKRLVFRNDEQNQGVLWTKYGVTV